MQETELFSGAHPSDNNNHHNYYYNPKRETIISNCSSIMEQNKIQPIKKSLLPQTNTMTNKYKLNLYDSSRRVSDIDLLNGSFISSKIILCSV
ncbi:unnamed protein product [Schistosoma curassoni]|uniref:Uncharacterized protein n=1 Tax=Schistosoma curassoni TaxID=6186 RepID=A0A183JKD9_9TREM|nr:unnamed protein product [Schistosoma curassoni]